MAQETQNGVTYEAVLAKVSKDGAIAEVDTRWSALSVITHEHKRIHDGQGFFASYLWSEGSAIADNANAEILIQVGSTPMHLIYDIAAGGDAEVHLLEAPTVSTAGTAVTSYNKLRVSLNASNATITHTPSLSADGTALGPRFIPGGVILSSGNEGGTYDREVVLDANEDYVIRATNRAGTSQPISISMEWYEDV